MAKKTLKVGHFYYHKMYTTDVYCVLRVFETQNLKYVQIHNVEMDKDRVELYDSFLGKTKEIDERYWKNFQR